MFRKAWEKEKRGGIVVDEKLLMKFFESVIPHCYGNSCDTSQCFATGKDAERYGVPHAELNSVLAYLKDDMGIKAEVIFDQDTCGIIKFKFSKEDLADKLDAVLAKDVARNADP